jgi:hypothetical protein
MNRGLTTIRPLLDSLRNPRLFAAISPVFPVVLFWSGLSGFVS